MKHILCWAAMVLACAGCAAQSYKAVLTWQASPSQSATTPTLTNVYRGVTTNGSCAGMTWTRIATGQPAAGPYNDPSVLNGVAYCYEVRAYFAAASSSLEGGGSNWAYVSIPTPKPSAPTNLYAVPESVTP